MRRAAVISGCDRYRYSLTRDWDSRMPTVMFICLNPSTADAVSDDATVRRCVSFAKRWGYGRLFLMNLFGLRATDPRQLAKTEDPIGPDTNGWLTSRAAESTLVMASWGNGGILLNRDKQVRLLVPNLYALRVTKQGQPAHPLYLKSTLKPQLLSDCKEGSDGRQ